LLQACTDLGPILKVFAIAKEHRTLSDVSTYTLRVLRLQSVAQVETAL